MKFESYFKTDYSIPCVLAWDEEEQKYIEKLKTSIVETVILTVKSLRNLSGGIKSKGKNLTSIDPDFRFIFMTEFDNIVRLKSVCDQAVKKLYMADRESADRDGIAEKAEDFWFFSVGILGLMTVFPDYLTDLAAKNVREYLRLAESLGREICYLLDPIHYSRATERIWNSMERRFTDEDFNRLSELNSSWRAEFKRGKEEDKWQ